LRCYSAFPPRLTLACTWGSHVRGITRLPNPPPSSLHRSFGADTWFGDRCCVSSLVRCRSRAAILVALVTFGVICHAQMPRPDASDDKSCATELAICQALLGAVRTKENVVRLAAVPPSSSKSTGARTHSPAAAWAFACADCMSTCQPAPCRPECARRKEHERHGTAGRHRALCRVECNELRGKAAGLPSAQ
jgi:hypothetical protein